MYVVIGTTPFEDTSVVVGPFRTIGKALKVSREVDSFGYSTEVCEALSVSDLNPVENADD